MAEMDEQERKIVNEFCHLLEKSKQLFNGLRDLPQYGHKQWQAYFGRTFDIYTKLWKFQQQHRQILDSKYGLKRWQIGEIASKIGQLYYHYYLRTSETNYLNEAFSFYAAIRGRAYYSRTSKDDRSVQMSDLMVKKLRYYARFIVVCFLLKRMKLVRDLVRVSIIHIYVVSLK
ncbi:protein SCAI-like isoform X2 [Penaeus japonicus]|uniref:protein SCAI-like isoform X2 n=1 Tax=Penaeus japonicus TaxID=27405 RepID=UPI001C7174E5|nr:protein SCAI-like isoform X2 [Penaeus japonicus]